MFDATTAEEAAALVSAPEGFEAARKFVGAPTRDDPDAAPDHWQDGAGMTAPMPSAADVNATTYTTALKAAFVVEDCTSDVWERKVNGLLGHEPAWSVEPDRDEDGEPDPGAERDPEAEAVEGLLRAWWARQHGGAGGGAVLREWAGGMALPPGRSYLRLFVPRGRLVATARTGEDGVEVVEMRLHATSPEDALRHIFLEHVYPDQAALHTDRDMQAGLGVVTFETDDGGKPRASGSPPATVEMTYLKSDEDGAPTVLRVATPDGEEALELDLGGRLTLFEGRMRPTVTVSVVSNQRDLNTYRTMAAINSHKAGFPELVFVDVEPPADEDGDAVDYESGPGNVGFFVSAPKVDASGLPSGTASGSVTRFGPVDNATLQADATVAREAIFRGAKQFHVLALSGANLSGEAMIQGQGEFLNDLLDAKAVVDAGGRWVLETAWRFACALGGAPERAARVRAVFDCRPSAGPLSAAVRAALIAEYDKGLRSAESTMSLLGVDDIEAERGRIAAEAEEKGARDPLVSALAAAVGGDGQAGVNADDLEPETTNTNT